MKYYKNIKLIGNIKNKSNEKKIKFKKFIKLILIIIYIIIFFIRVENKYYSINNKKYKLFSNNYMKKENKTIKNLIKLNGLSNELYSFEKKPKISILIPHFDSIFIGKNDSYIAMLKSLLTQSLKEIEILISFKKINTNLFYLINQYYKNYKILKIFEEGNDKFNATINLILNSDARYITVIKKCVYIKEQKLFENVYKETFGKTDNIYKYKIEGEVNYLIKKKVLNNIIDDDIKLNDFIQLENYIKIIPTINLNYISIAYSFDNNYILYAYISIISILESKNYNTYTSFYLIVPNNFTNENKNIILSLYEQYDFLNFSFIYMDNRYKKVKIINYISKNAYYRLSLGELLPNINKIIYLDCDVIVYKDLTNLYNKNFNKHIMLSLKRPYEDNEILKINDGVLLMNLKEMRKIKFEKNILNIINKGLANNGQDQGLLIKYYLKQIGYLDEEYNVLTQGFDKLINYNKNNNLNYKNNDLFYKLKYPTIRHANGPKKSKYYIDTKDWWYFASKAKYYYLIIKYKNLDKEI